MSEFWMYTETGLRHVFDIKGYSHVLFLTALLVPFVWKDWKRILLLLSVFTIGHLLAMLLSVFHILTIKASLIAFLIPVTILITAVYNLSTAGKPAKSDNITAFVALFFGAVHGLRFSEYFRSVLGGSKLVPLLEFELGIVAAQIITAIVVLLLSFVFQNFLKFSRRDFTLVFSAFVIGVVLPAIIKNDIWN